jgi:hypothetical protein
VSGPGPLALLSGRAALPERHELSRRDTAGISIAELHAHAVPSSIPLTAVELHGWLLAEQLAVEQDGLLVPTALARVLAEALD